MRVFISWLVLILIASLPAAAASDWARLLHDAEGTAIWVESSAHKAWPDDAPPMARGRAVELAGARGERVCFQLVFRSQAELRPEVGLEPLKGPVPITPGPKAVRYVGWTTGNLRSGAAGRLGLLPDPLMEQPVAVPAGRTAACWVQLDVGEAPAGKYTGRVRMRLANADVSFPVQLTVWDLQVPATPTIQVKANVWGNYLKNFDKRDPAVAMADYTADLLDHRVTVGTFATDFKLTSDGGVEINLEGLADRIRQQVAQGFQRFWIPSAFLGDASGWQHRRPWKGLDPATPEFEKAYADYVRKLADHLRAEGLLDRMFIEFWDEPAPEYYDRINRISEIIRKAAPDLKIFTSEQPEPELDAAIDAWCVALPNWYNEERAEQFRARGDELWCYDNFRFATDYPAMHMRSYPWVVAKQRFAGVLWWCINYWRGDPYKDATPEPVPSATGGMYTYTPGNGSLLYPNPAGEGPPVDSLRWEQFREGLEEAELLLALTKARGEVARKLGEPAFDAHRHTRELAGLIAPSVAAHDAGAAALEETRRLLAEELLSVAQAPLLLCHMDPLTDGPTMLEQVRVVGLADEKATVMVNGNPAQRDGTRFGAEAPLKVGPNEIKVVARGGGATKTVSLQATRTTERLEQVRALFASIRTWGPDLSEMARQLESDVAAGRYSDAAGLALLKQARQRIHDWIMERTLLPNGAFEKGLEGWNNSGDLALAVSDEAFFGTHSLHLRDESPEQMIQYFSDYLPAKPGQDYLLSASALVKSASGPRNRAFRVSVQFFADDKYLPGCERGLHWNQAGDDWQTMTVRATAPAEANRLRATIVSYKENVGEALLDDVAIMEIER